MAVLACCFVQLARCKEMKGTDEICTQQPFLDPRTWDSWGEFGREEGDTETGVAKVTPEVRPLLWKNS